MSRIADVLAAMKSGRRKALIPYITAGDPSPQQTVGLMHALVQGGADILELGVPFSDPMADGPVIQLACERALKHGTNLHQVIQLVTEFRRTDSKTPVVLMGYLNPIESMGLPVFARRAKQAGVDGVLVVDLAVEEAPEFAPVLRAEGLDCVFLLAPTSSAMRIQAIAHEASGYLYYVSLKGVTGASTLDMESVKVKLGEIRRYADLPLAVGFGVRDAATAAALGKTADAVVVGSALVSEIEKHQHAPDVLPKILTDKLLAMRNALDAVEQRP
ncbi:MAG: tryptophan synthase subunit alpha [Pseudomonadota bacterium]